MPYMLMTCKVLGITLEKRIVTLKPLDSVWLKEINVDAGRGLKFMSSHAPGTDPNIKPISDRINNVPFGHVSYPYPGDIVLAAVYHRDYSKFLVPEPVQSPDHEVIILGKLVGNHPYIESHDRIFGDASGAKIHFNHGWDDVTNLQPVKGSSEESGEAVVERQKRMGHVTVVANRLVRLAGSKFLPFGLLSHWKGKGKTDADKLNPKIVTKFAAEGEAESGTEEAVKWSDLFTRDPTETVFSGCTDEPRGTAKFLDPPCPEPGEMMDMHESGTKKLVEASGQVREYKDSLVSVIGDEVAGSSMKKLAFEPDPESGDDEATQLPNQSPGEILQHLIDDSGAISTLKMKQGGAAASAGLLELEINGISVNIKNGNLPTGLPVTFGGETVEKNKIKIKIGGTVIVIEDGGTVTVDITAAKFKIDGDLEVTGSVTGGTGTFG